MNSYNTDIYILATTIICSLFTLICFDVDVFQSLLVVCSLISSDSLVKGMQKIVFKQVVYPNQFNWSLNYRGKCKDHGNNTKGI